jgi:hypothetical protein
VFGPSGSDININDVLVGSKPPLPPSAPSAAGEPSSGGHGRVDQDGWRELSPENSMKSSNASHSLRLSAGGASGLSAGGMVGGDGPMGRSGGLGGGIGSLGGDKNDPKWRAMEDTINTVGDWAVRALPALLEILKKGGKFEQKDIDFLRPSFKAALYEAHEVWEKKGIFDDSVVCPFLLFFVLCVRFLSLLFFLLPFRRFPTTLIICSFSSVFSFFSVVIMYCRCTI